MADDWTTSMAASDKPFETDTRVWYTGGNPAFDAAFAVVKVSNGFICDTGGHPHGDDDGVFPSVDNAPSLLETAS